MEYKILFQYGNDIDEVIISGENAEEIRKNWNDWAESRGLNPTSCYRGFVELKR
jgi:hypothetical protein